MATHDACAGTWMLDTGETFYAYSDILGIDAKGEVTYGYDGSVDATPLSPEGRIEIGRMMVERWSAFVAQAEKDLTAGATDTPAPPPPAS